jgi:hypothetical protein
LRASDTARKTCDRPRRAPFAKFKGSEVFDHAALADPLAAIDAGLDDFPTFDAVPDDGLDDAPTFDAIPDDDETKKRIDDFIQANEEDAPPIGDETPPGDAINEGQ